MATVDTTMTDTPLTVRTRPQIYCLARQNTSIDELNRFLGEVGATWQSDTAVPAQLITEVAGRVCYLSFSKPRPGGNSAYLAHIKEVGHGSVLEHAVWTLIFTGVSRTLTHELVRHRAGWSYSQLSQRYVDESEAEYVIPQVIDEDDELRAIWHEAIAQSHRAYVTLVERLNEKIAREATAEMTATDRRKAARQAARSVLANACETKITVTVNARAVRHFLESRGSRFAEPEIRLLANRLHELMLAESPHLFNDYVRTELPDGTFELTTPYPKV